METDNLIRSDHSVGSEHINHLSSVKYSNNLKQIIIWEIGTESVAHQELETLKQEKKTS